MNHRVTNRERGLIKGALRRVFSRSELRRSIIDQCIDPNFEDKSRPRVKKWGICAVCKERIPKSYLVVDHLEPVIPVNLSFEEMSLDDVVDRLWCDPTNLQPICPKDHLQKTKEEAKLRKEFKKGKKDVKRTKVSKRSTKTNRKGNPSRSLKPRAVRCSKKASRRQNHRN